MRLDKLLSNMGLCSRSEASTAAKKGEITVNGVQIKDCSFKVDENRDEILFRGKKVGYEKFFYVLLNKPQGIVSSTDGKDGETVVDLLPDELKKRQPFPCGRLDKDTVGFLLITNDGELSHRLLSPSHHVEKTYRVIIRDEISLQNIKKLEDGTDIGQGEFTKPAKIEKVSDKELLITICEGMYHQIKRMLTSVGNKVEFLERVSFGGLFLPSDLERGKWRFLTNEELNILKNN